MSYQKNLTKNEFNMAQQITTFQTFQGWIVDKFDIWWQLSPK